VRRSANLKRKGQAMKHYLYNIIDKRTGFSLGYYYYSRTKAEKIAKAINKAVAQGIGDLTYKKAIIKKLKKSI
jgi:transposase